MSTRAWSTEKKRRSGWAMSVEPEEVDKIKQTNLKRS